jgi:hypothetical protein
MFSVATFAQQVPTAMLGDWSRIQGETEAPLSVGLRRGQVVIDNHLDGEGYGCELPLSKARVQEIGKEGQRLLLITGAAVCRAEENPKTTDAIVLLYSKSLQGEVRLVFADGSAGGIELLEKTAAR